MAYYRPGLARLPLVQGLSDTEDGPEAVLEGRLDFAVNQLVVFAEELPSFRMAQDDVVAQPLQHGWGDFAGKGSGRLVMHVLGAKFDWRARYRIPDRGQRDKGGAKQDFDAGNGVCCLTNTGSQGHGLGQAGVHLPVAGNQGLWHGCFLDSLKDSLKAGESLGVKTIYGKVPGLRAELGELAGVGKGQQHYLGGRYAADGALGACSFVKSAYCPRPRSSVSEA